MQIRDGRLASLYCRDDGIQRMLQAEIGQGLVIIESNKLGGPEDYASVICLVLFETAVGGNKNCSSFLGKPLRTFRHEISMPSLSLVGRCGTTDKHWQEGGLARASRIRDLCQIDNQGPDQIIAREEADGMSEHNNVQSRIKEA